MIKERRRDGDRDWQCGIVVSIVWCMNEVALCWARLVLGWVTIFRWVQHLGK